MKKLIRLTERDLHRIVEKSVRRAINENLKTYDDEYNIYEKLDELDIPYDFINDRNNIIEIETENDNARRKVFRLLNYYGWKPIKDNGSSICAERIYGDEWDSFEDKDAENDSNYPSGVGIYYHITPYNKVNKILKQGLTVRDGKKFGYDRGDRIYLISYPSKDFINSLIEGENTKVAVLLVDISKYVGNQIKIYHDDFTSDEGAVYTYDYIPPKCIKLFDVIEPN